MLISENQSAVGNVIQHFKEERKKEGKEEKDKKRHI